MNALNYLKPGPVILTLLSMLIVSCEKEPAPTIIEIERLANDIKFQQLTFEMLDLGRRIADKMEHARFPPEDFPVSQMDPNATLTFILDHTDFQAVELHRKLQSLEMLATSWKADNLPNSGTLSLQAIARAVEKMVEEFPEKHSGYEERKLTQKPEDEVDLETRGSCAVQCALQFGECLFHSLSVGIFQIATGLETYPDPAKPIESTAFSAIIQYGKDVINCIWEQEACFVQCEI